jgi:hypothetical protein
MSEETLSENLVQLDLNNLLAAIIHNLGVVAVPMTDVLSDYSDKSLAISLDDESNMLILDLVDTSTVEVEPVEVKDES